MQWQMVYILIPSVAFLGGLGLGLLRRGKGNRPPAIEIPQVWPFDPRRVANSDERKVWAWLRRTFHDHQVLLKMPIMRFVMPQRQDSKAREWCQLLSGVYCTFTVCTADGRVIGCIDVMSSPDSLPLINRQIKETLLEQCGINYWAVLRDRMPNSATLRTEFVGANRRRELDAEPPVSLFQPIESVRQRLHETLDRNRAHRSQYGSLGRLDNRHPNHPGFVETQPLGV